jgi:hypothetical protein
LGPLERANLNHWKNPDDGQSPKTQYLLVIKVEKCRFLCFPQNAFEISYKIAFSHVCIIAERLLNRSVRPFAHSFVRMK